MAPGLVAGDTEVPEEVDVSTGPAEPFKAELVELSEDVAAVLEEDSEMVGPASGAELLELAPMEPPEMEKFEEEVGPAEKLEATEDKGEEEDE